METTVLALMLCLVMPSLGMMASGPVSLSMMPRSVDDMYDGCREEMKKKVENKYFPNEKNSNQKFRDAWMKTESCVNDKYNNRKNKMLTRDQFHALVVYTGNDVYDEFNAAVRDGGNKYATNEYKYHALQYWLTTALQTLKPTTCPITYRRTTQIFTGDVNQEIRFGQFASSSTSPNQAHFGTETCFHIETCLGAPIKDYSCFSSEDEVLIPPYETFKIIQIAKGSYGKLVNCKKIFVLKNTGRLSNLNCDATQRNAKKGCLGGIKGMFGC